MEYCYHCGTKLEERYLEKEGMIPYCTTCKQFIFPIFSSACSMLVLNQQKDQILLIKQYGREHYVLVSGYINIKENAENTVRREVKEEVDLDVISLSYNKSEYFEKSNTLMFNFTCVVNDMNFHLNDEVDEAKWFPLQKAREVIMPNSLAKRFLEYYLDEIK